MFSWPLVCIALFVLLPLDAAAIWSMLGAYLLLPSNLTLKATLVPPLDKMAVASISAFILCWMKGTNGAPAGRSPKLIYLFCLALVVSPILTSLGNSYELLNAKGSIPGFYPVDGLKVAGRQLISLLPLFMGLRFLSTDTARARLLRSLPAVMLIYSLPMFVEMRLSPQLHQWVYGYNPSLFGQAVRDGGFRPIVFTEHGLALAFFTSLAVLAAVAMVRMRSRLLGLPPGVVAGYLSGLLVLCKSLGPTLYALLLSPLILFARPRTWARVAFAGVLLLCAYPVLRNHGLVPGRVISQAAGRVSDQRSESYETRYKNEGQLLAKANQKPLFGWGTWGRNRVYDPNSGQDISITDGGWIIWFGTYGWFGYISLFGLLATALFSACRATGNEATPRAITLGALTLLLGVYVIDQIPNANPLALIYLLAGMVGSRVQAPRTAAQHRRLQVPHNIAVTASRPKAA